MTKNDKKPHQNQTVKIDESYMPIVSHIGSVNSSFKPATTVLKPSQPPPPPPPKKA